jgi:hypothetical protein
MTFVINGTTGATQSASFDSASTFGFKNRIINGAMVIDQRNAGATVTPTNGAYTLDRWFVYELAAGKFSVGQNAGSVTPPVGFSNYLGATSLSAYTVGASEAFSVNQRIEGYNFADMQWGTANAKTITLSFWVYSSLTGTFGGALTNSAGNRSYPFSYTVSSANTWTSVSVTIAGDTTGTWIGATNGNGVEIRFGLGSGSTYSGTSGAWAAGNYVQPTGTVSVVGTSGATFYITGVQLEKGSTATSFDYRPYGTELALCQRYYQQGFTWFGKFSSSTSFYGYGTYQVEMRAAPTATYIAGGSVSEIGVADRSVTAIPSYSGNNKGGFFQATVSGAGSGAAGANAAGAPTVAGFSAEL